MEEITIRILPKATFPISSAAAVSTSLPFLHFFLFGSFSFFQSRRLFHSSGSGASRIGPVSRFLFELVVPQAVRESDAFPIKLVDRTMMGQPVQQRRG